MVEHRLVDCIFNLHTGAGFRRFNSSPLVIGKVRNPNQIHNTKQPTANTTLEPLANREGVCNSCGASLYVLAACA